MLIATMMAARLPLLKQPVNVALKRDAPNTANHTNLAFPRMAGTMATPSKASRTFLLHQELNETKEDKIKTPRQLYL
jgi:hypothetical protein